MITYAWKVLTIMCKYTGAILYLRSLCNSFPDIDGHAMKETNNGLYLFIDLLAIHLWGVYKAPPFSVRCSSLNYSPSLSQFVYMNQTVIDLWWLGSAHNGGRLDTEIKGTVRGNLAFVQDKVNHARWSTEPLSLLAVSIT